MGKKLHSDHEQRLVFLKYNQLKLKKTGKEMENQKRYQEYFRAKKAHFGSTLIQDPCLKSLCII